MVAVMGVTPVALHHHDTSSTVVSTVISLHIAGMWVFSPVIGAALDRFGRRPGLIAGGATSVVGALFAATDAGPGLVAVGLFAIGLGWSATFLGATAVISDLTEPNERAGALGFTDLLVSLSSAVAGLAGGFVFEGAGSASSASASQASCCSSCSPSLVGVNPYPCASPAFPAGAIAGLGYHRKPPDTHAHAAALSPHEVVVLGHPEDRDPR